MTEIRKVSGMIFAAVLSGLPIASAWSAEASALPAPNKLIALVQSADCNLARLRPEIDATSKALVGDSRTTRVVVDWPVDPQHNVDLMGRPSPLVAALEVWAAQPAALAGLVQNGLGSACHVGLYIVHERRLLTTPRTWQLGEPSPQPKTLSTLVRKEGLLLEEFDREWAGPHAQIALSWRAAAGQHEGHYVQNLVLSDVGSDTPPLDGIGEGEGPGPMSEQERAARMKAAEHARTFADMTKATMFITRETVLKD